MDIFVYRYRHFRHEVQSPLVSNFLITLGPDIASFDQLREPSTDCPCGILIKPYEIAIACPAITLLIAQRRDFTIKEFRICAECWVISDIRRDYGVV